MNELALFAGAGGGILGGLLNGWRTVCAVEWDAYAASVLVARQNDRTLAPFPVWDDVQTFDGRLWRGVVDVVSGGFPCTDISAAGKGAGIDGDASGMWSHMARIIGEVRPRFVFVENSPLLVRRGLARVLGDLAALGYDARWGVLGAADVGAPHQRDRIWIVATDALRQSLRDTTGEDVESKITKRSIAWVHGSDEHVADARHMRRRYGTKPGASQESTSSRRGQDVANTKPKGLERQRANSGQQGLAKPRDSRPQKPAWSPCGCCGEWWCNVHDKHTQECPCPETHEWESDPYSDPVDVKGTDQRTWWTTEPDVGRVAHGVANRVDRLRCIGNGQVPAVVRLAWEMLQ
jgi:DNA (cytosine-5)-methyltransferase 1